MLQAFPTNRDIYAFHPIPLDEKLFILFTLAVGILVLIKLLLLWWKAPPFRRSLPADLPAYALQLRLLAVSLKRWLLLPLFAWGILFAHHLYELLGYIARTKMFGISALAGDLQEQVGYLLFALCITLFALFTHWHIRLRLEKLKHLQSPASWT
jgi:hypothetical protein